MRLHFADDLYEGLCILAMMIRLTQKVKQGTQYTWRRMEFVKRRDLYEHKQSPMDNFTNHGISEEGGSLDAHLRRWHRKHNGGC